MSDSAETMKARLRARAEAAILELGLTEQQAIILDSLVLASLSTAIAEQAGGDVARRKELLEAAWAQVAAAEVNKVSRALNTAFIGLIADVLRGAITGGVR